MICENCASQAWCNEEKSKRCHEYFESGKYLEDIEEDNYVQE